MGTQLAFDVELTSFTCGECGGVYALAERYRKQKHAKGGYWNCPYCQCSWGYSESDTDRLKEELAQKEAQIKREQTRTRTARADATYHKNVARSQKGAKTRLKNRIANGVCPCCQRTFKQLARHMKNKHPNYKKEK